MIGYILLLIFCGNTIGAQDITKHPKDFIAQEKELIFKILDDDLSHARRTNNIKLEITTLASIIRNRMLYYGDNTETYEQAVYLENLIRKNDKLKGIESIRPEVNLLMGRLLMDQFRFKESMDYYSNALQLSLQDSVYSVYRDASNYLGEAYYLDQKALEAIKHFKANLNNVFPFDQSQKQDYQTRTYEFLAEYYLNTNQLDSTLYFAKKSLYKDAPIQERSNRNRLIANALLYLSKEKDSIFFYGNRALDLAESIGAESVEINAHYVLMEGYQANKNFEKAFYHYEKYNALKEKQWSYENAIKVGALNLNKERENTQLKEALANEKLGTQKTFIWLTSIALLILIGISFYIANRGKLIRKKNRIIQLEKQRAEESERHKEQFLANMSHEIRTPMHAISGMLNTIRRQPHPKHQDRYLEAMKISSDNLLVLLNDVLDMSKIESGNLDITYEEINPRSIVKHVLNVFELKAQEKGVELRFKIANDIPKIIMGDPSRFYQILLNLIGNALKFTEDGFVSITLNRTKESIHVAIQDTGIGISSEQLTTIFQPFKQGVNINKGTHGGTGLGLSITKQLIELQKGEIWVKSDIGKGSTFHFELPLFEPNKDHTIQFLHSEEDLIELSKKLEGLSILIAEDNEFNAMVVQDDLNYFIPKAKLTLAVNGQEAFDLYTKNQFDLILMDVQMPEKDGHEVTKLIREIEQSKDGKIPIIAMTASLLKSEIDKCYQSGMDAFIPKPYKPNDLINTIYNLVYKY